MDMRRRALIWHIFPTYLLVLLVALIAVTGYSSRAVQVFYQEQLAYYLEQQLLFVESRCVGVLDEYERVQDFCAQLGWELKSRITLVLPSGKVLGDSGHAPETMDNHAQRPEIANALLGGTGHSIRYSKTLHQHMLYVAIPLTRNGICAGVVRAAVPLVRVRGVLWRVYMRILGAGIVVALLAALISWMMARRLVRPLREMRAGAQRFAEGDFSQALSIPNVLEMGSLARAMNRMAHHLDSRIRIIMRQRNQQEAVLSSMAEGVLAIDNEGRIIALNESAARLLSLNTDTAFGSEIKEVFGDSPMEKFVLGMLYSDMKMDAEFVGQRGKETVVVQVHGAILRDVHGQRMGTAVVLNDMTRLRRLERVRRDFVANVSHELRTPITSIKGFVETLLDGAKEDPEASERFLRIIAKQADRLNAILSDLLTLAQIEEGEKKEGIELEVGTVRDVLDAAVQACASRIVEKDIDIEIDCDAALRFRMNASLLEQAVTNLVDNAVKYSDVGGRIVVRARETFDEVTIQVRDWGCGIPPKYVPRLFERFYRVDKGRSRSLGGTGLGLAIVRHITNAHRGYATVDTEAGKGATFSLYLPK